jgi:F-type H+-transporting ATPase subunit a
MIAILVVVAVGVLQRMRVVNPLVPDRGMTVRNLLELVVEAVFSVAEDVAGRSGRQYTYLFGSFFIFILVANLFGLVPGLLPPTDNFNVTFGCGLIAFFAYHCIGVREHGVRYLKQFVGPVWILAIIMVPIELVGHLVRPFSLGLRLFGNIFGDHLVLGIFTDLTKVVVPVVFYLLGAFVAVIQAFVFTLLSMIYVGLATSHEH